MSSKNRMAINYVVLKYLEAANGLVHPGHSGRVVGSRVEKIANKNVERGKRDLWSVLPRTTTFAKSSTSSTSWEGC